MKIKVNASTMVKPMIEKPSTTLRLSNLDVFTAGNFHIRTLYFYRSTGAADFFDPSVLKAALSRVLVDFYPVAGRLKKGNDRMEINCNGKGALLVEAEADGEMDELGNDFAPRPELSLIPEVDYSLGISTYPILMLQITRFKCGGVCLGVAIEHIVADGFSDMYFINTWSDISRGLDITIPPFFDRCVVSPRNPPKPLTFAESHQPSLLKAPRDNSNTSQKVIFSVFKLTRDQLNALKANCREEEGKRAVTYSTYEALAGHVWRCVCWAGGLQEDEEKLLYIPVDGRPRLRPSFPQSYFGNVVFAAMPVALCGELKSNPLKFAVRKIHEAIAGMNDEWLRSTIDLVESIKGDLEPTVRVNPRPPSNGHTLRVTSWAKLPIYDADFGWGRPVYMGLGEVPPIESTYVLPSPTNDGSLLFAISLPKDQMHVFEKLLYDI